MDWPVIIIIALVTIGILVLSVPWPYLLKNMRSKETIAMVAGKLRIRAGPVSNKFKEEDEMALILTDEQKAALSIQPTTAAGNPAAVDGVPIWSVSDPTVLTLTVATDGLSAEAITVGPLGPCQVSVQADADLGAGVTTLTAILDVQVVAAQAANLNIVAGPAELK